MSSVWREWVQWCVEFGVEANAILVIPYEWRLLASRLEERDLYFHKLKSVNLELLVFILLAFLNLRNVFFSLFVCWLSYA